ncbi:MAG: DNA primase [Ruminococcaceae bacterium]|nr:DNA primase [Oscillospiraceae bacterium]
MAFPESFLDDLAARSDIYDIVSRYVTLKKSGSNWFGLCPFHSEKTGSFSVNTEKQIYHCFGCGAGGSVYNFIMQIENLSFPEAVEFLANLAGVPLPQEDTRERDNRKRLLECSRDAARFFFQVLHSPEGKIGYDYLIRRGLRPGTIRHFGLGFAPDSWDKLMNHLAAKGYTKSEMRELGLIKANQKGGFYDQFRNRIMFPIIDVRGNVIAFGGRVMDDSKPKYLNSPEHQLFSKSRNLFALNYAKKTTGRRLILAEGYMDVIALHQAGFTEAVASLGTALTPDQAKLIKRFADEVVISYDADEAGQKATSRAMEILKPEDLKVRILRIPGAKDPDEFIREHGREAFSALLERSEDHMEFVLDRIRAKCDLETDEGRVNFLKEAAKTLARLSSPIEREIYASRAAASGSVSKDALLSEIERNRRAYQRRAKNEETRKLLSPEKNAQPASRALRYTDVKTARAEEGIIALLYREPEFAGALAAAGLSDGDFTSPFLQKICRFFLDQYRAGNSVTSAALSQCLEPGEMSELGRILSAPDQGDSASAGRDYIRILKESRAKHQPADGADPLLAMRDLHKEKKSYGGTK